VWFLGFSGMSGWQSQFGARERTGINPFTKEETVFKAKPASNVAKIVPLKGLKDMV
jgi:hypothetical protein